MNDQKHDPFFDALKADIQDGVAAIDRGNTVPAQEVWTLFERRIAALSQDEFD